MINIINKLLGIKSPSLEYKKQWDVFISNFRDGFEAGLRGEFLLTPEERKAAWKIIYRSQRSLFLLDANNYKEYPDE